jgi:methylthioribose-1-phosphate isomerase
MSRPFSSIVWQNDQLVLLDQKRLPHEVAYKHCTTVPDVFDAIVDMTVRGAPAIGIAAAYGVFLGAQTMRNSVEECLKAADGACQKLSQSRPTAVNLFWALGKMQTAIEALAAKRQTVTVSECLEQLLQTAHQIYQDDIATNLAIAKAGFDLIPDRALIVHHCNTGSLATADYGTALGVIRYAHEQGKQIHVFLDETRPRMQGASLSAFEMKSFGVPHTVIIDSASGFLMKQKKIDLCIVGCDRVCANGDTANKIGTYNLALVARAHQVPFYVAAPWSTIDPHTATGNDIEIEERAGSEVTQILGSSIAPVGTAVWNPAFDVTPGSLITAFVTERGIASPPYAFSSVSSFVMSSL